MIDFRKHALILAVIEAFQKQGKNVYKHQLQKVLYLLSLGWEVPFSFVFYRRGPHSFDIETELEQMLSYGAIRRMTAGAYDMTFVAGANTEFIERTAPLSPAEHQKVAYLCELAANWSAPELDRVSAAGWIRFHERIGDEWDAIVRLRDLKPSASEADAQTTMQSLNTLLTAV